jgi:hypothetical protein
LLPPRRIIFSTVETFSTAENFLRCQELSYMVRTFSTAVNYFDCRELFWLPRIIFTTLETFSTAENFLNRRGLFRLSRTCLTAENYFYNPGNFFNRRGCSRTISAVYVSYIFSVDFINRSQWIPPVNVNESGG